VAFRQALAKEILLREGKEGKEGEDVIDSDEEKESVNMARIQQQQQQQQQMRVLEGDFDAMAREAREAAMLMVRAHSGCERVEHVRDKAKATVMVYVEYEGVPSAASFATDKKSDFNNEDGERDDGTIQTTNVSLEDDFKAMRHFNVKRPNDRQKNWKKRKRREGRKPEWELVLSQPEPKYLAAFEDSRLEYSRVRKETSTDGFLRAIKNATTETLMSALYNNTYKAVRMKQDEEKKENPIAARVRVWASPVYVAGRYAKFARDVPQSPWSNCPVKWARATESVQDALEDAIVKSAHADGAKFNSSGREDLDVRMLGDGRPFVLEVHNPKASVSELRENLVRAETLMNQSSFLKTDVKAFNLRVVPKETYKNVGLRLDSNEKEKSYSCVCICDPPVPMDSTICDVVSAMKDVELKQQTPIRVSHRRSDLVRPRTLREIKVTVVPGTRGRCVYVDLRAEAGTYIKEFCHGDKGRTNPSLGDLLGNGTKCDIIQLDVTKVDAVGFDD
jgi:tRNA pseudouridine synthase 10